MGPINYDNYIYGYYSILFEIDTIKSDIIVDINL